MSQVRAKTTLWLYMFVSFRSGRMYKIIWIRDNPMLAIAVTCEINMNVSLRNSIYIGM